MSSRLYIWFMKWYVTFCVVIRLISGSPACVLTQPWLRTAADPDCEWRRFRPIADYNSERDTAPNPGRAGKQQKAARSGFFSCVGSSLCKRPFWGWLHRWQNKQTSKQTTTTTTKRLNISYQWETKETVFFPIIFLSFLITLIIEHVSFE